METPQKTIFVTGATGFIGSPTVQGLYQAGFRVIALLRSPTKRALIEPWVESFVDGDLSSDQAIEQGVKHADVVLHLASALHKPWNTKLHQLNIDGTQKIARACARASRPPHLILVSSLAARGPTRTHELTAPISAYGRAKKSAEDVAIYAYTSERISIVRPPMVFGPKDPATQPIFDAIKRGLVPISRAASARFSMIDVRDLAQGLVLLADADPMGAADPIYFSFQRQLRMEELATLVAQSQGLKYRAIQCPNWLLWCVCAVSELHARLTNRTSTLNLDKYHEMTNGPWTCDPSHAESHLSWAPSSSLPERLSEVFDTYD